jgi:DNA-3-methyladenine glycosylase
MKLPVSFYQRKTIEVAKGLLGQRLVHVVGGRRLSGLIVETEAYLGVDDPACHSRGGLQSKRNASMYLEGGHAYVYLIYGLHYCMNVVTRGKGEPEAVLIRAIEPLEGVDEMRRRRKVKGDKLLTNGPGKLCQALGIAKNDDGCPLTGKILFIEKGERPIPSSHIVSCARIGVDYAGPAAKWPYRFYLKNHPFVSRT